jgi:hypothetical protein
MPKYEVEPAEKMVDEWYYLFKVDPASNVLLKFSF